MARIVAARRLHGFCGFVLAGARDARDPRTGRCERNRNPLPDPAARAGDDRGLAGQVEGRRHQALLRFASGSAQKSFSCAIASPGFGASSTSAIC